MSSSEKIINYSSVFASEPALKNDYLDYVPRLDQFERDSTVPQGTT